MGAKAKFLSRWGCRKKWQPAAIFLLLLAVLAEHGFAQRAQGIDVSQLQGGSINWSAVKSSGASFAFVKAAEGTSSDGWGGQDADFTINMTNAKAARILVSYYYSAHPEAEVGLTGADVEASFFWNIVQPYTKADGLTMSPMLDIEEDVTKVSPPYTASTLSAWANEWCNDIINDGKAAQLNLKPMIFTYGSYANGTYGGPGFDNSVTNWPLDMDWYNYTQAESETGAPMTTSPWPTWSFWEYSWVGAIPTSTGTTNGSLEVFNGTSNQLSAYLVTPTPPAILTPPASITVYPGVDVTLSVLGSNVTHYQWAFNGTNISAATNTNYVIHNAQLTNAGGYTVQLTNSGGSTLSAPAFVSVLGPLTNSPGAIIAPANMADWWPADGNCFDIFASLNGLPHGNFCFVPGKSGEAFHFDGSTTFISNNAPDIIPPWTACMWVNYSHTPQTSAGLLEDGVYSLKLEQKGSVGHSVGISQIGYADTSFNYAAPTGTWVHLAFVATTSNVTLYANGVNEGSIVTNSMPLPRTYMGAGYSSTSNSYADFMLGSLDNVMLFSRALGSTEISNIYQAGAGSLVCAPHIIGGQVTSNANFNLNIKGITGKSFNLLISTNLITWTNAGALANPNGTNTYVITNVSKYPQIYFKVSQPY